MKKRLLIFIITITVVAGQARDNKYTVSLQGKSNLSSILMNEDGYKVHMDWPDSITTGKYMSSGSFALKPKFLYSTVVIDYGERAYAISSSAKRFIIVCSLRGNLPGKHSTAGLLTGCQADREPHYRFLTEPEKIRSGNFFPVSRRRLLPKQPFTAER